MNRCDDKTNPTESGAFPRGRGGEDERAGEGGGGDSSIATATEGGSAVVGEAEVDQLLLKLVASGGAERDRDVLDEQVGELLAAQVQPLADPLGADRLAEP